MGSSTLFWSDRQLARLIDKSGGSFMKKIRLGGRSGDLPFEISGGPDYDLFLRVERTA
jgi:hypothetical protein